MQIVRQHTAAASKVAGCYQQYDPLVTQYDVYREKRKKDKESRKAERRGKEKGKERERERKRRDRVDGWKTIS